MLDCEPVKSGVDAEPVALVSQDPLDLVSSNLFGESLRDHQSKNTEFEILAAFQATCVDGPLPTPIVNFDVNDVITAYSKEQHVSAMDEKLKKLRKKRDKKLDPQQLAFNDDEVLEEISLLEALQDNNMSAEMTSRDNSDNLCRRLIMYHPSL